MERTDGVREVKDELAMHDLYQPRPCLLRFNPGADWYCSLNLVCQSEMSTSLVPSPLVVASH